jgi:hypothetical protein
MTDLPTQIEEGFSLIDTLADQLCGAEWILNAERREWCLSTHPTDEAVVAATSLKRLPAGTAHPGRVFTDEDGHRLYRKFKVTVHVEEVEVEEDLDREACGV